EPVPLDHHLGHPGTAVVAARHRKTVGAGRHEGNEIVLLEHRDFTPLYQEISRLADRADDIGDDHAVLVFFHGLYAVIRVIESRPGQIVHSGIDHDEVLVVAGLGEEGFRDQYAGVADQVAARLEQQMHPETFGCGDYLLAVI